VYAFGRRCAAWRATALAIGLFTASAAAALELPLKQTFPYSDDEFRALDSQAFALASRKLNEDAWAELGGDEASKPEILQGQAPEGDLGEILARLRVGVAAKYGVDSRQMQDMYVRESRLFALASRGREAVGSARSAVKLGRRSAAAYALLRPIDPLVRLTEQTGAFHNFVDIAASWQDEIPGLAAEAFQVAQMAELSKPALVANRRLMERELPAGEIRDLTQLVGLFIDQEGPLDEAVAIANKLGPEMRRAGVLTDEHMEVLAEDVRVRNQALELLLANSDKLEAALLPKPLTLEEIQLLLDDDEAYVAFAMGAFDTLVVFCVTRDAFALHSLDTLDWLENVEAFRGLMGVGRARSAVPLSKDEALPEVDQWRLLGLGWALYSELFSEIEPMIENKSRLLLSVQDELMKLPFEALVTEEPGPSTSFLNAPWFVRSHAVTVLPTIAMLRHRAETGRSATPRFLGIGNPDYRGLADWEFKSRETMQINGLLPLPESADEVRRIGAVFNAAADDLLVGPAANEKRLETLSVSGKLAEYDVILFATHGLQPQELDTVLEPSLALTPTFDAPRLTSIFAPFALSVVTDGLYKSREIEKLQLDADLVILSACNSAADNILERDGYSGLAGSFMKAGANTVMVSHWPVISDAAVEITTRTMGHLDGPPTGKPLALAMRAALIETIDSGGDNAHPRYWAPFSLFGAP